MRSIVIKGAVDKHGHVTAPLSNVHSLSRNKWEFRISSVIITPVQSSLKSVVYELGCSLNNSECFNYVLGQFMDKNTPLFLISLNAEKNESQKIDLSQSVCPWLKLENVKDTTEISFYEPGTNRHPPKGLFSTVMHMWIRRK